MAKKRKAKVECPGPDEPFTLEWTWFELRSPGRKDWHAITDTQAGVERILHAARPGEIFDCVERMPWATGGAPVIVGRWSFLRCDDPLQPIRVLAMKEGAS